jgi:hypothetical protein
MIVRRSLFLYPHYLEMDRLQEAIEDYGHSAGTVFRAARNDDSRDEINQLIDRAINNIDDAIESVTEFKENDVGWHMLFEINALDDMRVDYEVNFTSTMTSERLLSWASTQQPDKISDLHDRLNEYPFKCRIALSDKKETGWKRKRPTT